MKKTHTHTHTLILTLCVFFFTLQNNANAQVGEVPDTPDLHEIFADPNMRSALLDATIYKDDKVPNLTLNNIFDVATNVAYDLSFNTIGDFSSTGKEQFQVRKSGLITLTTSHEVSKTTIYYTLEVKNLLWITWCLDQDIKCVRISDAQENCYQKFDEKKWGLFSSTIPVETLTKGFQILLEYK